MEKRYMMLEKSLCRELEMLEEKYRNGQEMSEGDIRRVDLLSHAMKSLATYTAMKQAENSYDNSSYNHPLMNNSYMSNNMGNGMSNGMNNNMSNNMNNGMSNGMNNASYGMRDMSGHYPMYPGYPEERRW